MPSIAIRIAESALVDTDCVQRARRLVVAEIRFEDPVDPAQFPDRQLQIHDPLRLGRRDTAANPGINLLALDPLQQGLRRAVNFQRNRLNSRPQRGELSAMLLNQAQGPFTDFSG